MNRWIPFIVVLVGTLMSQATPASAQVYKYTLPDGSIAYTDSLNQLPPKRRAFYNRQLAEARAREERIQKNQTPSERKAAERAAERKAALKAAEESRTQAKRRAALAIAARLSEEERLAEAQERAYWQEKKLNAEKRLAEALAAYRSAYAEWKGLAIKVQFAQLPGAITRRVELEEYVLPQLILEVDAANDFLRVDLPEEARRAGVPPGYLR